MFVTDSYQEGSESVKLFDIQTFVDIRGNLTLIRKLTRTRLDIMGFIKAITRLMVVCLHHVMTFIHVNSTVISLLCDVINFQTVQCQ